jgi:hypothetical protein
MTTQHQGIKNQTFQIFKITINFKKTCTLNVQECPGSMLKHTMRSVMKLVNILALIYLHTIYNQLNIISILMQCGNFPT